MNMLKICLAFRKSEPQYAYKCYAYKEKHGPVPTTFKASFFLNSLGILRDI